MLTRPKTQRRFPLLTGEWVEAFVQNIESKAVVLTGVPKAVALPRDPKDEPYLDLAIAAKAHYLVSRDLDLLDLMHDASFRQSQPGLVILDPAAFLQEIARQGQLESAAGQGKEGSSQGVQGEEPGPADQAEKADGEGETKE